MRGATRVNSSLEDAHRNFNPRTPCGVRRDKNKLIRTLQDISIHAPHAGCDLLHAAHAGAGHRISIHAPHAGCDSFIYVLATDFTDISIHAPHAGCDPPPSSSMIVRLLFQSTHPMRGATRQRKLTNVETVQFQSTHPMRGATALNSSHSVFLQRFQSTHPMRGATAVPDHGQFSPTNISIHAPHAGCDLNHEEKYKTYINFNPRTPCGVRHTQPLDYWHLSQFQSTHPMRGATRKAYRVWGEVVDFNPRTPCGVRRAEVYCQETRRHFNPRTPCGVRRRYSQKSNDSDNFNPRTPCGVRPLSSVVL